MSSRAKSIAYWGTTGLLAFGMLAGGTGQMLRAKFNVDGMLHLGYPLYVLSIVGAWKWAGVIVLLAPRLPLMKEWAYAGFFFLLTSATASHIASGDGFSGWVAPFVFACLTVTSWWLRPADRRLVRAPASSHGPAAFAAEYRPSRDECSSAFDKRAVRSEVASVLSVSATC